jgi:hypothetical protein
MDARGQSDFPLEKVTVVCSSESAKRVHPGGDLELAQIPIGLLINFAEV